MLSNNIEIGVDCVEINRFTEQKSEFFRKVFTDKEIDYCENKGNRLQHYAGKFAGKEAVIKALHPFGVKLSFRNIEILNDDSGRPMVNLTYKSSTYYEIKISLSHSNLIAVAVAVVIKSTNKGN